MPDRRVEEMLDEQSGFGHVRTQPNAIRPTLDPGDVQLIALALGELLRNRPGWSSAIGSTAAKLNAMALLACFVGLGPPEYDSELHAECQAALNTARRERAEAIEAAGFKPKENADLVQRFEALMRRPVMGTGLNLDDMTVVGIDLQAYHTATRELLALTVDALGRLTGTEPAPPGTHVSREIQAERWAEYERLYGPIPQPPPLHLFGQSLHEHLEQALDLLQAPEHVDPRGDLEREYAAGLRAEAITCIRHAQQIDRARFEASGKPMCFTCRTPHS